MAPATEDLNKAVFDFIMRNDLPGLKAHMSMHGLKPNICDEHGMSALTHACYKGNKEISQYLLDQGADVNSDQHEHQYTALHFAALSGNADLCQLLLDFGAKPDRTNSVGKTAAQIGGFVGNHRCVSVINNYIPRSDIDYYTVAQAPNKTPFLPPTLASSLHKLIMQVNIHPIRIALTCSSTLNSEFDSFKKTLALMSEKEMKKGPECNEVMAFKLHYLSFVVGEIATNTRPDKASNDCCEVFIKRILKPISGDKYLDSLIRECIREFPHKETTIFRQMVTSLVGTKDPPPAFNVISTIINGARFLNEVKACATCSEETASKKCSKCREVQYCDRECQRLHWFIHKKECNRNSDDLPSKIENVRIN